MKNEKGLLYPLLGFWTAVALPWLYAVTASRTGASIVQSTATTKEEKKKGHCVTSDTTTTTTFPITTTTTLPTHLLIIFKAVYNITSAVRVCVATTKRRKERNASGCWTERRERERERTRSIAARTEPTGGYTLKNPAFFFSHFGVVVCFIFISLLNVLT